MPSRGPCRRSTMAFASRSCAARSPGPTERTHDVIRANFHRSPLFAGAIEGRGPRYCPSIEDKVKRFGDRDGHQIFLEPEGLDDPLVYPNGISTSLAGRRPGRVRAQHRRARASRDRRARAMRSNMNMSIRGGSARRWRCAKSRACSSPARSTAPPAMRKRRRRGWWPGSMPPAVALDLDEVRFDRRTSYIGVMIDDLTLQGVSEPYRMMTARAEYRLSLRADNATTRLGEAAIGAGCVSDRRRAQIEAPSARFARAAPGPRPRRAGPTRSTALCRAPAARMGSRAARLAGRDPARTRLSRDSRPFERNGRAPGARPGRKPSTRLRAFRA